MSPVLYATIHHNLEASAVYQGIVVEDVREDYKEIVRFFGASFSDDVTAYLAWVDGVLQKHENAEIYESDLLRDEMKRMSV